MNGQCPRCGALPALERRDQIKADPDTRKVEGETTLPKYLANDLSLWGTHYDRESDEWQCVECGCAFKDDTPRRVVDELLPEVHTASPFDGRTSARVRAFRALDQIGRRRY